MFKAKNRREAVLAIETQEDQWVELDYGDGCHDLVELGRLGRKYRVSVAWRGQEAILVESLSALKSGLARDKDTFRSRHLYCSFDLNVVSHNEMMELEARSTLLGDYIFPWSAFTNPHDTWAN